MAHENTNKISPFKHDTGSMHQHSMGGSGSYRRNAAGNLQQTGLNIGGGGGMGGGLGKVGGAIGKVGGALGKVGGFLGKAAGAAAGFLGPVGAIAGAVSGIASLFGGESEAEKDVKNMLQ